METKRFKMPRRQKKGFKKWAKNVRGVFVDPTNPNVNAQHILEDLFSLYKSHNCLGKPLFSVGGKNGKYISEKWKKKQEVSEEERESSRMIMELIKGEK